MEEVKLTQKELILMYLKQFGSITPMDAFIDLRITKLATRISEMKKQGYKFKTETIHQKNRFGRTVSFAKYSLIEEK